MDKINVEINGEPHWIEGGDFEDMLSAVRSIPDRKFDRDEKVWQLKQTPAEVAKAIKPYRLMYRDTDELADSEPTQIHP